jgi:uncharacterized membrane protein (DUF4010 family)
MKRNWGIVVFGLIEIAIGSITLISTLVSFFIGKSTKPPQVLVFVLITSAVSLCLGIGILRRSLLSYHLLIFFAIIIIFSKVLIFAKIISLTGDLETSLPPPFKNAISLLYHSLLIWYFTRAARREYFRERRKVLISLSWPCFGKK